MSAGLGKLQRQLMRDLSAKSTPEQPSAWFPISTLDVDVHRRSQNVSVRRALGALEQRGLIQRGYYVTELDRMGRAVLSPRPFADPIRQLAVRRTPTPWELELVEIAATDMQGDVRIQDPHFIDLEAHRDAWAIGWLEVSARDTRVLPASVPMWTDADSVWHWGRKYSADEWDSAPNMRISNRRLM